MRAFLSLPAMFLAATASAQTTGSRIFQDEFADAQVSDQREVRLIGARFGDCVVRKQPAAASTFVLAQGADLDRAGYRRLMSKLIEGNCLIEASRSFGSVQMRFPADTMRYTLADALFRAAPGTGPLAVTSALPGLAHPTFDEAGYQAELAKERNAKKKAEMARRRSQAFGRILMSAFGECVVRANPAGAYQLLRSGVLTPEENAALTELRPAFGQCLEEGQTLSLNKAVLRGAIALNHYRLAQALRQGAVGKTEQPR